MKAEQRKELETNTLADKMGQTMQRVKAGSRRTAFLYFVGLLVLAILLFLGYRWYAFLNQDVSSQWVGIYDGAPANLHSLMKDVDTPAAKSARLQFLWIKFWEGSVKQLGTDQRGAILRLKDLEGEYKTLASACKDEPIFEAQAMLGQAVVVECLAVQDLSNLARAKRLYEALAEKHGATEDKKGLAEGKFARDRLEMFKDKKSTAELQDVYARLQLLLAVPPPEREMNNPFPDIDFDKKKPPVP